MRTLPSLVFWEFIIVDPLSAQVSSLCQMIKKALEGTCDENDIIISNPSALAKH